jgi:2-polyprenyl-6-methoxyphenol hydroxylase-like FAD-dependent oxidoreductase
VKTGPLKLLICSDGISRSALAYWLTKGRHHIVVIERFSALRTTGAQVDLREQGIEAAKRMGFINVIRSKLVHEAGVYLSALKVMRWRRSWLTDFAGASKP